MKKLKILNRNRFQKEMQAVVDLCLEDWGMSTFPVKVKDVHGGRCNRKSITLPAWLLHYDEAYQIYYAVHEACHRIRGRGHGPDFKNVEDQLLAKFGIKIRRKKAYPRQLWLDGKEIIKILGRNP